MDRCRTVKGVFIPGCIGAAAMGKGRCTCRLTEPKLKPEDNMEKRIKSIEKKLDLIISILNPVRP